MTARETLRKIVDAMDALSRQQHNQPIRDVARVLVANTRAAGKVDALAEAVLEAYNVLEGPDQTGKIVGDEPPPEPPTAEEIAEAEAVPGAGPNDEIPF